MRWAQTGQGLLYLHRSEPCSTLPWRRAKYGLHSIPNILNIRKLWKHRICKNHGRLTSHLEQQLCWTWDSSLAQITDVKCRSPCSVLSELGTGASLGGRLNGPSNWWMVLSPNILWQTVDYIPVLISLKSLFWVIVVTGIYLRHAISDFSSYPRQVVEAFQNFLGCLLVRSFRLYIIITSVMCCTYVPFAVNLNHY